MTWFEGSGWVGGVSGWTPRLLEKFLVLTEQKIKKEKEEENMRKWRNSFKSSVSVLSYSFQVLLECLQIETKIGEFLNDPSLKRSRLPPYNKLSRSIM